MARELTTVDGHILIVDDEDWDFVSRFSWRARRQGNMSRAFAARVTLGEVLLRPGQGQAVLQFNHDSYDYRRRNLIIGSAADRARHRRKTRRKTSSRYKGVSWNKADRRWVAMIMKAGIQCRIGSFANEKEAALAYDAKARELFEGFACVNFPLSGEIAAIE